MKIRTFELCAGYDSQLMALERLKKKYSDFDYECIGWSEIEPNAIALHNACFPKRHYYQEAEIPLDGECRGFGSNKVHRVL